jgi:translation initiation factor 1
VKNTKLVWSDDPKDQKLLNPEKPVALSPEETQKKYRFVAIFRLEKSGRAGKTVTVIDGLPKEELFLKALCKEIKSKCGVGGTFSTAGKEGLIEIQGDKRKEIKELLSKKGIQFKGM